MKSNIEKKHGSAQIGLTLLSFLPALWPQGGPARPSQPETFLLRFPQLLGSQFIQKIAAKKCWRRASLGTSQVQHHVSWSHISWSRSKNQPEPVEWSYQAIVATAVVKHYLLFFSHPPEQWGFKCPLLALGGFSMHLYNPSSADFLSLLGSFALITDPSSSYAQS